MKLEDFDYELPNELIAQTPLTDRSSSKLLIMNQETGEIEHRIFTDILDYLHEGDVLVLNDTLVIPARLIGEKEDTHAVIELLLLNDMGDNIWECLSRPFKRLKVGSIVCFGDGILKAKVVFKGVEGIVHVKLLFEGILMEVLDKLGEMPLPPYIHEKLMEKDRYNTVYAKNPGSAAAPTAGLHFTDHLLELIKKKGVIVVPVTLHVGLGTFRPVEVSNILDHHMHSEYYKMSEETANILNLAKKENRRIIAVGTTSTRVLETVMQRFHSFQETSGYTDIFIYPGYEFQAIDCLITNFHLPKSTLLMLVSALSNREYILHAYKEAISHGYRFFSFGDSMFLNKDK